MTNDDICAGRKRNDTSNRQNNITRGVEKKKAQNRAAQKSFREKQQSYVQYLESFVETVKSGHNTQDAEETRYNKLLRIHLDLLENYHTLHDTCIRLRQKLWGIGQSAASAAGQSSATSFRPLLLIYLLLVLEIPCLSDSFGQLTVTD
jgi:hypothetical protein